MRSLRSHFLGDTPKSAADPRSGSRTRDVAADMYSVTPRRLDGLWLARAALACLCCCMVIVSCLPEAPVPLPPDNSDVDPGDDTDNDDIDPGGDDNDDDNDDNDDNDDIDDNDDNDDDGDNDDNDQVIPDTPAAVVDGLSHGILSVGDVLKLRGQGFDPNAALNVVDFNGIQTTATAYESKTDAPSAYDLLTVTVPTGATTGDVRVKAASAPWSNVRALEIRDATIVTLNAGQEANGVFNPELPEAMFHDATEYWYGLAESWILGGSNFTKLMAPCLVDGEGQSHACGYLDLLALEVEIGGTTQYVETEVVADNRIHVPQPPPLTGLKPGDTFRVRLIGNEGWSMYRARLPRYSNWLTLAISDRVNIPGAFHRIDPEHLDFSWPASSSDVSTPIEVARGDWLCFYDYSFTTGAMPRLTCPGLWDGVLNFMGDTDVFYDSGETGKGRRGLLGRSIPLPKAGTYTVTNETNGETRQIVVKNEGVATGGCYRYANTAGSLWKTMDVALGSGGTRVFIPAGAFPDHAPTQTAPEPQTYGVEINYSSTPITPYDPEQNVFVLACKVVFSPEPPELLKPITITVPYGDGDDLPVLGAYDESTGQMYKLSATVDAANHRVVFVLPAGKYPDPAKTVYNNARPIDSDGEHPSKAAAARGRLAATATPAPTPTGTGIPSASLNRITERIGATFYSCSRAELEDEKKRFFIDYIDDPSSGSYVSDAYANELLDTMLAAYDQLSTWKKPAGQITVTVRAWKMWKDAYGSTSAGIFGEPVISINTTKCPAGSPYFYTTAAHEVGHAFQRQYTSNITAKWFDEASAEWAAFATVGVSKFGTEAVNDSAPFILTLPTGFWLGYDQYQSYAASPWPIWMNQTYPGSVREVYANWDNDDSYATFEKATGDSMVEMYDQFAEAFWTQSFEPFKTGVFDLDAAVESQTGASPRSEMSTHAVTVGGVRPTMSSYRYTLSLADAFKPQVADRMAAVRTTGLTGAARVVIYGENLPPAVQPSAPKKIVQLTDTKTSASLGKIDAYRTYRIIVINPSKVGTPDVRVSVVVPNITSLSPASGSTAGGYSVTVNGSGFGTQQGSVSISGQATTIQTWADNRVVFTMPNVGLGTGSLLVTVRTAEDVPSNAQTFTFN